jgi:hypothetical protein
MAGPEPEQNRMWCYGFATGRSFPCFRNAVGGELSPAEKRLRRPRNSRPGRRLGCYGFATGRSFLCFRNVCWREAPAA